VVKILIPKEIEKYKAIVFDFDGVIVESNLIKRELFFEIWDELRNDKIIDDVLSAEGSRYEVIEQIYLKVVPFNLQLKLSLEDYILKYTFLAQERIGSLEINHEMEKIFKKYYKDKLLFVNSATPTKTLNIICDMLGIKKYFIGIFGLDKSKIGNFNDIFVKYNLSAKDILFYGDMQSDQNVAEQLKIDFAAVYAAGSDLKLKITT